MVPNLLAAALWALSILPSTALFLDKQQVVGVSKLVNETINFDDLKTKASTGLGDLSPNSNHHNLHFTNFTPVHTPHAYEAHQIAFAHEMLCATSSPTALFASNFQTYNSSTNPWEDSTFSSRIYLNSTASLGDEPVLFNLLGFSLAPLGITGTFPYDYVQFYMNMSLVHPDGFREERTGLLWSWGPGAHEAEHVNFRDMFGPEFGSGINMIDMWMVKGGQGWNGEGGTEWGLCIDDLEVEWVGRDGYDAGKRRDRSVVTDRVEFGVGVVRK